MLYSYNAYYYSFIGQSPTFCAVNSTGPSLSPVECSHNMNLPSPEVVDSPGHSPQDHFVVLTNVGLWWKVAYKFRIPLVEGNVVSMHKVHSSVKICFHEVNI